MAASASLSPSSRNGLRSCWRPTTSSIDSTIVRTKRRLGADVTTNSIGLVGCQPSAETVVVPTSRPMIRKDQNDKVYRTMKEKHDAILADIQDCVQRGQPVLVGTTSIENSEFLSDLLTRAKLPHNVLNAKQHAREAEIVAEAGRPGIITIATNMAGRGTDIVLGGNVEKQVQLLEADPGIADDDRLTSSGNEPRKTGWFGSARPVCLSDRISLVQIAASMSYRPR